MSAAKRKPVQRTSVISAPRSKSPSDIRLSNLSRLAAVDIETPLVENLSGELHALFDHVSEDTLPIYFGPLLGRLYLEGL